VTNATENLIKSDSLAFDLPLHWKLLGQFSPPDIDRSPPLEKLLSHALENLIACPNLETLVRHKKEVVIISDDKSRPTPANLLLPPLLDTLNGLGIPDESIKIIVGRGLHPTLTEHELREKFGLKVIGRVKIYDHDPRKNLTFIGKTPYGTHVSVNSLVAKADLKIGLGCIMPHELAGYTGGSGIVIPGVAGQETINQNHCLVGTFDPEFGKIEGNTIREDMEEAARLLRLDLIVNAILTPKNEIVKLIAGDPIKAHHLGVSWAKQIYGVKIPKKADIVITGSSPNGGTFGKAMKALFAAQLALKKEGTIIFLASCREGISSSAIFRNMLLQNPSSELLFQLIERGELPGESCVLYLFSKIKQHRIIVVTTDLPQTQIEQMGLEFAPTLLEAMQCIPYKSPDVIIFPKGTTTLPLL
jgi:nickel-dependent lactate racemase